VTSSGYTEDWFSKRRLATRRSAEAIAPFVRDLVRPGSVIDLGCGTGSWLAAYELDDVLGVDGDYVLRSELEIPTERFVAHDLQKPFRSERTFDLALSIEVAEHLPQDCAAVLVRSLVELAPAVLFSAAVPHQPGTGHVNCRWPDYWRDLFARHDYAAVDCIRPRFWDDPRVRYFHAQNLILYVRRDHLDRLGLEETSVPRLVHPRLYESAIRSFPPRSAVRPRPAIGFLARLVGLRR
jgi:SAM-dependent methyltransferase